VKILWAGGCFVLSCMACRPSGQPQTAPTHAAEAEYRGKLVITGTEPGTSVRLVGDSGHVELAGALEPELRRLAGASVVVRGSLQGDRPAQTLMASDYEVTQIDGATPATGLLTSENGKLWLAGRDTLELAGAPDALRGKEGAKIWVVGRRAGDSLEVQSYGIIREPGDNGVSH
jgi:hypothetical protein